MEWRPSKEIIRIEKVRVAGSHSLDLEFSDGLRKTVDVLPLLQGPIFKPLLDPEYFGRVLLDPVAGTVVWPNGADLAPEALHELPEQGARKAKSNAKRKRQSGRNPARRRVTATSRTIPHEPHEVAAAARLPLY